MLQLLSEFMIPIILSAILIMTILVEIEEASKATTLLFVVAGIFGFLHFKEVSQFLISHPKEILIGFLIYVFLGICWSILKWTIFVKDRLHKIERLKNKLEKDDYYKGNEKLIIAKLSSEFIEYHYRDSVKSYEELLEKSIPEASEKKGMIISWISYFPLNILSTVLNNPLRRFFEWVYESVSGIYDKITSSSKKRVLDRIK